MKKVVYIPHGYLHNAKNMKRNLIKRSRKYLLNYIYDL